MKVCAQWSILDYTALIAGILNDNHNNSEWYHAETFHIRIKATKSRFYLRSQAVRQLETGYSQHSFNSAASIVFLNFIFLGFVEMGCSRWVSTTAALSCWSRSWKTKVKIQIYLEKTNWRDQHFLLCSLTLKICMQNTFVWPVKISMNINSKFPSFRWLSCPQLHQKENSKEIQGLHFVNLIIVSDSVRLRE